MTDGALFPQIGDPLLCPGSGVPEQSRSRCSCFPPTLFSVCHSTRAHPGRHITQTKMAKTDAVYHVAQGCTGLTGNQLTSFPSLPHVPLSAQFFQLY